MNKQPAFTLALVSLVCLACLAPQATLAMDPPAPAPTPRPSPFPSTKPTWCAVTAHALNLREAAGTSSPVLAWLEEGDRVLFLPEESAGWRKVQTPAGQTGWINSKYCEAQK